MRQRITTTTLAAALKMNHADLIRLMSNIAFTGAISSARIPVRDGRIRYDCEAQLSYADAIAIMVHVKPDRDRIDAVASYIEASACVQASIRRGVKAGLPPDEVDKKLRTADVRRDKALAEVFGDAIGMRRAFNTGDPSDCGRAGIRLVGDTVWIGTGAPYVAGLAKAAGLKAGELAKMLRTLPGAVPQRPCRFHGYTSRSIEVHREIFEQLIAEKKA